MKLISLKQYTLKYLLFLIPFVIALWAASFYWLIIDEVYDNIDDGLKDTELRIKKEIVKNPELLKIDEFGLAKFKFTKLKAGEYDHKRHIYNSTMYMIYDEDYEPVRMLQSIFRIDDNDYLLEIYASTIEEDEFVGNLFLSLIGLYIVLVISMVLLNRFVLQKAWQPFYSIMAQLGSYKLGREKRIDSSPHQIMEFATLEKEINEMIERNEKIYDNQKQFIENAAHELQTPIAIMSNKLELMLDEEHLNETQFYDISKLLENLSRLKYLNKSLLMLSKIENLQFSERSQQNFNDLTFEIFEELKELYTDKNLTTGISQNDAFEINMNPQLAKILLSNLIRNAFFHSPHGGTIHINLNKDKWTIENMGSRPLDKEKIFERFYHVSNSSKSSGLGLAIVNAVIQNYPKLSLTYHFDGKHVFTLYKNP